MAEGRGPSVFTIPPHVAFVDALAKGLLEQTAGDPMRLARGIVLLPNRRAVRALTDAFVRQSEGRALLLPRMMPIGDVDEDEALGSFAGGIEVEGAMLPAVDDCERRLLLTEIVRKWQADLSAAEAMRLADALARTIDGLEREGKTAHNLTGLDVGGLAHHWQRTLAFLTLLVEQWPERLAIAGKSDRVARGNALIDAMARRWRGDGAAGRLVVGAGIADTAPCVADLLGTVARLPGGMVVLPGLDIDAPEERWREVRCHLDRDEDEPRHDSESHPQFAFRCLLARMKVNRAEVQPWRWSGSADGPPERTAAVARAMAPAAFTADWADAPIGPDALAGVRFVEAATPAEEAQAIALALRRQLDTPGATAALVTPDRNLARRVAAHLKRYGVDIDDSAGTPLRATPPGTLIAALAEAAAQRFAPTALLAALKHPLVASGEARLAWLDRVRELDLALRGVRPPPGLDPVGERLDDWLRDRKREHDPLGDWWDEVQRVLEPLDRPGGRLAFGDYIETLRAAGEALAGDELWRGPAGRALGDLFGQLARHAERLSPVDAQDAAVLLDGFLRDIAVRPPGRHPRLAIYGLIEARLQRADLMILGGLNEGVWPPAPSPDPWLAPAARGALRLPGVDRRVGIAAHDFVQSMGAPRVILTRARRDDTAPAVPSRFWLRLTALGGDAARPEAFLPGVARAIDACDEPRAAEQPRPAPPPALRPRKLHVTGADKLKADPYSFYAEQMLGLRKLKPLDEDATAAERGTFIHAILEEWIKQHKGDPDRLRAHAQLRLSEWDHDPLMRALWAPRVSGMIDWVIDEMARWTANGWQPLIAEKRGDVTFGPVTLTGKLDRLDRNGDGSLAIVDYKTGGVPSHAQVEGGYALQLGLLAHMASRGAFGDPGAVTALRYWKLSGGRKQGEAKDPLLRNRKPWIEPEEFASRSVAHLQALIDEFLLGAAPFTAKLKPEYSTNYTDHDQVARVAEWWGRRT